MQSTSPPIGKLISSLSLDRNEISIALLHDDVELGAILLNAPEVESLIHQIAFLRSSMAQPIPAEIERGARMMAADNPAWRVRVPVGSPVPGVVLALRHPGLGWLANWLPRAQARALARSMLDQTR